MGTAVLSQCEKYRYSLTREISLLGDKTIAYFGVNPSTADAHSDDPTVRKWIGFSQLNNGRNFIVGNLFAYRAVDVQDLNVVSDPVGSENDSHLLQICENADILVPCWGSRRKVPREFHYRLEEVFALLVSSNKPIFTFGFTATGDPLHPLFLPYSTPLVEYVNLK